MAPKTILVVEDSTAMRSFIVSTIEMVDAFSIVESANGFEALKILPRYKFDLILTDINMPDINGLELINFLKSSEEYRDIPLIIITTESSARDQQKGLSMGANEYLAKPFKPEELQKLIRKYV